MRSNLWLLIGAFVVLVVGAYLVASPQADEEIPVSTTFNADPQGVKAFYTLLGERLGYNIRQLTQPYTELPDDARVLIAVRPQERMPDDGESEAISRWVDSGGIVILVASSSPLEMILPDAGEHGDGKVYVLRNEDAVTNKGMRNHNNAMVLLDIITRHAGRKDLILFDDYHHGVGGGGSQAAAVERQVKIGLWMLAAAALVLCHTRGRRFGAVRKMPASETVRPGIEFVDAVGRLYQRAHAPDLAADVLCRSFRQGLCRRLGLPSDASNEALFARSSEHYGAGSADQVRAVVSSCERAAAGQSTTDSELLRVAREIRSLEKQLLL